MFVVALGCLGELWTPLRESEVTLKRETSLLIIRSLHFGRTVLRYIQHVDRKQYVKNLLS